MAKHTGRAPVHTVRGLSADVVRRLHQMAAARSISLNRLMVEQLTAAAGGELRWADFSDLVGRWQPDRAMDDALDALRQVDAELWAQPAPRGGRRRAATATASHPPSTP
ncbi:MAG: hypothetical protein ACRD01_14880 [Terriglobales bacterium]